MLRGLYTLERVVAAFGFMQISPGWWMCAFSPLCVYTFPLASPFSLSVYCRRHVKYSLFACRDSKLFCMRRVRGLYSCRERERERDVLEYWRVIFLDGSNFPRSRQILMCNPREIHGFEWLHCRALTSANTKSSCCKSILFSVIIASSVCFYSPKYFLTFLRPFLPPTRIFCIQYIYRHIGVTFHLSSSLLFFLPYTRPIDFSANLLSLSLSSSFFTVI